VTDNRWSRVKAIFEAAVERAPSERGAFVASAAGDDEALRREVEALLLADAAEAPALDWLPERGTPAVDPPARIGPYEIIALLGEGAMGQVYRGRDRKLNRDVALKVLPPLLALDPDRMARFRREAQMLAALSHPNIAAIYGFEDSGDVHALILELVDGETLAERVASGPLRLEEALPIAHQIAEALEAAHEKGIVHRDLKPANIKIDGAGVVKVLDFGLAKLAVPDSASPDLIASHEGLILGTASYMSPEQARGHAVDKRGDIWAFGCVLYEMLTGRLAFAGDTVSDTIARILEREPDWSAVPAGTPPAIQRLLSRCLTRNPRQRMRDIGDVRVEIDALDDLGPGGSDAGPWPARRAGSARRPRREVRSGTIALMAASALAGAVGAWLLIQSVQTADNPLQHATLTPLTDWEGNEEGAEISPNGELVAFLSDRDGEFDIWVSQIGSGFFHNLTEKLPPLAASGFIVRKLGFSADSSQLWFNPGDGKPPMIMPSRGGAVSPFLRSGTNTPAWIPDGSGVAFVDKANRDDPIYLADRTGADERQILPGGPLKNVNPVWSADSYWLYFSRGAEPQDETAMDVWRLHPGGKPEQVTSQHLAINFLTPFDSRKMLYVARAEDRSGPRLWSLDVRSGASTQVPGVGQYMSVSASRDGHRIVATIANPSSGLWQIPLRADRPAEETDAQRYRLPVPTGNASAPRFGTRSLFYLSAEGTGDGLWKVENGEPSQVRRGVDGAPSEPPAVSVDGRLAVTIRKQGRRHLTIMAADGTSARTLAPTIDVQGAAGQSAADWSPDGTRIVVGGRDQQGAALFIISADTGEAVRLVNGEGVNPVWSPRDDLIVYAGRSVIGQVQLLAVRPNGESVDLPRLLLRPGGYRFLPDGTGLVYIDRIQSFDFWLLDLTTLRTRQLARLGNQGALRTFDITRDGHAIVFDRSRQNSNVVLIEVPPR